MQRTYFVNINAAFDQPVTANGKKLIESLTTLGVPRRLLKVVQETMKGSRAIELRESFNIEQGDTLSATLFILMLEDGIRKCDMQGSINIILIAIVVYADDFAFRACIRQSLIDALNEFKTMTEQQGLSVNGPPGRIFSGITSN